MFRNTTVALFCIILCMGGLSCAVAPPPDGSSGNGDAGDGGGSGDGGGGDNGDTGGGDTTTDFIGGLTVTASRTFSDVGAQESLTGGALFTSAQEVSDDTDTTTIGDCVVTTVAVDEVETPDGAPVTDPLDAGFSGTLMTATGQATLVKQAEGLYATEDLSNDDAFNPGETFTFEFDGGVDIAGFMTSIELPLELTDTTPDISDENLTIDTTADLDVTWTPSGTADHVTIQVTTANSDTFVSIVCTVDDTGAATVPQAALDMLLDSPVTTTLSITRTNSNEVMVDLADGGAGTLIVTAQTGVARTITASLDSGDVEPCDLIDCPEGTTCNPLTFTCE